jgi:hypothetical protein
MTEGGAARRQRAGGVSRSRPPIIPYGPQPSAARSAKAASTGSNIMSRARIRFTSFQERPNRLVRAAGHPRGRGRGPSLVRLGR